MSGGAMAVAVLGMALSAGIASCLAREIRRHRATDPNEEIMPVEAGPSVARASAAAEKDPIAAEFERGYRALTAYLSEQARSGGSSQSAE